MKRKIIASLMLSVFIWHISYGFSIGNFFNPIHWVSKAFKTASIIAEEMWKFKPSDIGKVLNPFELGKDSTTRAIVLGMKLRRTMMEEDFGLMDTMTLYGFKMYETGANLMPGDYEDKITAEMIKVILSNDEITKEFIKEALKYDGLSKLMLRVAERNPEILDKLVQMMSVDDSVSYMLIKLALQNRQIGKLLFRKMNNTSFRVLINSMYRSKDVTKVATELFKKMSDYVFSENSNFKNYFFLPENSIYVEKMMYSVFRQKKAIDNFETFFSKIPQEWQFKMTNYITNGINPDGAVYPDEPYYFMHAVIKGIIKGKTLKHLISKDKSKYESLSPVMDKFMLTLITGAKLYNEEEHKKLLNQLAKMGITSDEDKEEVKPDPNIPPPRIESTSKDEEDYFRIDEDKIYIDLDIKYKRKFFGFSFKGKDLYASGDKDKWLLLPYWLSPLNWILLSNKKEDREIPNTAKIGKITLNSDKEFLVFIIASQFSPCVVWALKEGFVPIYGEFIESEKQTGFVLLGKVFSKEERTINLYGNGGGFFNYVVGIIEENNHPMYLFARNKILNSKVDYKIVEGSLFDYAKFDSQTALTIKPDGTELKHKVHRVAIPMFNDAFFKENKAFIMIHKKNKAIKIEDLEKFNQAKITYPPTDKQIVSMVYKNGTYIATSEDKKIYYSKDGINWKSIKTGKILYDITYGNGRFVAVGEDGYIFVFYPDEEKIEKLDRKKTGTKGKDLLDVEYINGEFFAVGEDGIIAVSSSTDKETIWETYQIDIQKLLNLEKKPEVSLTKIAHFDKYYVLTDNGLVLYSNDLTDWQLGIQLDTMSPLIDIAYNPERNIITAVGLNGVIVSSKDGINWDDTKLLDCESFVGVIPSKNSFLLLTRNGKIVKFVPYYEEISKTQSTLEDDNKQISTYFVSSGGGCLLNQHNKDISLIFTILTLITIQAFIRYRKHYLIK